MTVRARLVLWFYNAILVAFAPVLLLKKAIKFGRRGHAHEWDSARWIAPPRLGKVKKRAVFVALSWGEVAILNQLSQRLEADFPDLEIVWSIRDRGAQEMAKAQFGQRKIVPMPFDFAIATQNWLASVAPDMLVIVEKFWWPNLIFGAKARGAKIALINGRSRGRDRLRYRFLGGFQRWVLGGFDLLLFESESQIERVREVLPRTAKVQATGNVKFAFKAPEPPPNAQTLQNWLDLRARNDLNALPLLIAGSTSPVDELWALEAFQKVRREVPCTLLLAPRRVGREIEIEKQCQERGFIASRRSTSSSTSSSPPITGADVLILDTLGELSHLYQFGVAAYVGGAVEGRGHNIIEPLAQGIAPAYGPNRGDFEGAQRAAEAHEVGFRLQTPDDLAEFWLRALRDSSWRESVKTRAQTLIDEQKGALDATLNALKTGVQEVLKRA